VKRGDTPLKLDNLQAGEHELAVSKAGYFGQKQNVKIIVGETNKISLSLSSVAYLKLDVIPHNADITVNDKPAQETADGRIMVPAGDVTIRAAAVGYDAFTNKISIGAGENKTLAVHLTSAYGTFKALSTPSGATVLINRQQVGKTPYENARLLPGEYTVQLALADYDTLEGNLTIIKNQVFAINLKLGYSFGGCRITSTPAGATVLINGQQVGKTPYQNARLLRGEYDVQLALADHDSLRETVTIIRNQTTAINLKLEYSFGGCRITSKPAGATVLINGQEVGRTPYQNAQLLPGEYPVELALAGYDSLRETVTVIRNQTKAISLKLVYSRQEGNMTIIKDKTNAIDPKLGYSFGGCRITSTPAGATVLINGQEVGRTPYQNAQLLPGEYDVQLALADHDSLKETVTIIRNQTKAINHKLEYSFGGCRITSKPAGATVLINGQEVGRTPYQNAQLLPGEYDVQLALAGCDSLKETVTIIRNQTKAINHKLVYSSGGRRITSKPAGENGQEVAKTPFENNNTSFPAIFDTLPAEKKNDHRGRGGQWIRRIVFGALAAGCGGAGAYFNHAMENAYENYSLPKMNPGYYDKHWKEVETYRTTRNIFYYAAGAFAVPFIISIPF
jgi:hypothetical protein